jgi:hypothetical protein
MKIEAVLILLALSVLGWPFNGAAQTSQYVLLEAASGQTSSYAVQTNQLVQAGASGVQPNTAGAVIGLVFKDGAGNAITMISNNVTDVAGAMTGITNVTLINRTVLFSSLAFCNLQITTPLPPTTIISNYVPADAIVIPASATGNVQIILESSPDLVNWTAANPGTYGASAGTNRFFRVRAAMSP